MESVSVWGQLIWHQHVLQFFCGHSLNTQVRTLQKYLLCILECYFRPAEINAEFVKQSSFEKLS